MEEPAPHEVPTKKRLSKKEKKAIQIQQRKERQKANRSEERKKKKERRKQRIEDCKSRGNKLCFPSDKQVKNLQRG
jgi:hypothetical protein